MQTLDTEAALRAVYAEPTETVRRKCLAQLDAHCRAFIALSPFLCLATANANGTDVSPRGDAPGFTRVLDDVTLALPDWPGNNRLDSLGNVVAHPQVGLLFFVPGVDETLRVNGTARVTREAELLSLWTPASRSVLVIQVAEAFLHCGKALIRSKLWRDDYKVERKALASLGCMLKDQVGLPQPVEEVEALVADAYVNKLY